PQLKSDLRDSKLHPSARVASAVALAETLHRLGEVSAFGDPIAEAPPDAFRVLVRALQRLERTDGAIKAIEKIVTDPPTEPGDDAQRDHSASRQANAVIALLELGRPGHLWPRLGRAEDPRLHGLLIDRLGRFDVNPQDLLDRVQLDIDPVELQGVLLA